MAQPGAWSRDVPSYLTTYVTSERLSGDWLKHTIVRCSRNLTVLFEPAVGPYPSILFTAYCYGWYRTKRPMHCGYFLNYCASPSVFWFMHQSSMANISRHLVTKQVETWRKSPLTLPANYLCHTPQESLTWHNILRHETDGFTSTLKEVVIRIFIVLKNPSPATKSLGGEGV
jgi:hypothetical protein